MALDFEEQVLETGSFLNGKEPSPLALGEVAVETGAAQRPFAWFPRFPPRF